MDLQENENELSEQDCCGSGCNPCILDVRKNISKQKESSLNKNVLNQTNYVKFIINNIDKIAQEYLLIVLKLKESIKKDFQIILKIGQYIILHHCNISRSFTPISWAEASFTILVKLYEDGKMNKIIKKIKIGDEIDIRGPYGEFSYHRNSYKQIIMFSIGSGIAVMYPIINSIVFDDLEDTRIHLNSSFSYFSTIPLKEELRRLTDYWNFSCTIFLTRENTINSLTGIKLINNIRLNECVIKNILVNIKTQATLILICGTKEFNEMVALTVRECQHFNYYVFQ